MPGRWEKGLQSWRTRSKLATESGETATTIQEVTDSVVKAVNQLTKDSRRLLDFVATDVKSSYDSFESLADAYNRIPSLWTVLYRISVRHPRNS